MKNYEHFDEYTNSIHRFGRTSTLIILIYLLSVPILLMLFHGINANIIATLPNTLPILLTFTIVGISESISYVPIIGAGGTYIATLTGNASNMKIPAALSSMRIANTDPGTEKGDVIAIISIATSAVVTTVIVFLGMLFLAPIIEPLLNSPVLAPAFDNLLPALFGAIVIPNIMQHKKESIVPILIPAVIVLMVGKSAYGLLQGFLLPIIILLSVFYSKMLHKDAFMK